MYTLNEEEINYFKRLRNKHEYDGTTGYGKSIPSRILLQMLKEYLIKKDRLHKTHRTRNFRKTKKNHMIYSDCPISTAEIGIAIRYGKKENIIEYVNNNHKSIVWRFIKDGL